jgi:peptide/nickel transport system permease protein
MGPTLAVIAVQLGYLVGGLVVVESLFNYPGIGSLTLSSATGSDTPTLEACVLMVAILYMVINFVADLVLALLDPRSRSGTVS